MPNLFQRRTILLGATASLLAMPHIARAAVRVVKLGHNSVDSSQYGAGCLALAAAAAAHPDLAGAVRIEVHGNAELGDELPMMTDVRAGTIDMMAGVTSVAGGFCPEIGLFDAPFIFKSVERGRAAFDGPLGNEYVALLAKKDIHVVGWLETGLRHFTSNRAIRGPSDLVGLKLRVPPSQIAMESFSALGANAKPLAFNLLHEALRTGQFEAQENPIASAEVAKLYEVQKFLCLTGHTYSAGLIAASPDLMEDLTPKQLAALRQCARAGTQASRDFADAAARDGVGRLRAAGMTVIDDVDKDGFAKAARPNIDSLGTKFGAELVSHLMTAAA